MSPRERELPDLGALMLVVTLGITYTDFMAVLVMWYGDVPSKVFWFVERVREPWLALAIAAFIITSLVPIALLMFARVRANRAALRVIGVLQSDRPRDLPELAAGARLWRRRARHRRAGPRHDGRAPRRGDYRRLDATLYLSLEDGRWLSRGSTTSLSRRGCRDGRSSCWSPAC